MTRTEADVLDNIECPYIKRALDSSTLRLDMLTVAEFRQLSGFPIDPFMVDRFFTNLDKNIPIYVSDEIIEWCGFGAMELRDKKRDFNRILQKFNEGVDFWVYDNNDYKICYEEVMRQICRMGDADQKNVVAYPDPVAFKNRNRTKHIVVTTRTFKKIMMMLTTSKADSIREYYLALEELILTYAKYQVYYLRRKDVMSLQIIAGKSAKIEKLQSSVDDLQKTLGELRSEMGLQTDMLEGIAESLDMATDERAPRTMSEDKHHQFIIVKLNSRTEWKYYVIRAQKSAAKSAMNRLKRTHRNMEICVNLEYQPNAINLFNLIKENLQDRRGVIECRNNYIKFKLGENGEELYTHERFVRAVERIDRDRKNI